MLASGFEPEVFNLETVAVAEAEVIDATVVENVAAGLVRDEGGELVLTHLFQGKSCHRN